MSKMIFCDFDGTITKSDNIISIMQHFDPPGWEPIKDQILSREISIREGVGNMFATLPSALKDEIVRYVVETAEIRGGFGDFVKYTSQESIPLNIVSGGIDFFVEPILKPYNMDDYLYCNGSDFSGDKIEVTWPHSCDTHCTNDCGCCKPSIIRKLADDQVKKIVIGDSVTDLEAAKLADLVFVCGDYLEEKCRELNLPYQRFTHFDEVVSYLEQPKEVIHR
ncbi:2-hydroxy-3-keto-5-methylthiopentenyl-1-phosphate phosphatase [Jeotgalibacillus salarius]|uniref:2-hydroxy-3-keto-5-methylthiopentenyl-1-phosphate phosphatase n=1 Tax=Jeotgalibacillus salarius TaxID=546023 RepID=A0A4Y8LG31_9BACL|nr:2-hydroxy-3-keto-5-methylthiopentenyl-1-phosphate phosphatase [Jeotgalibacillus salarius]TFE01764.1 2-hydroxy-3-keto-5-methylthiopentenyl-1-phosphate phosphatase [Jeotgalibacillus salarius]